MTRFKNILVPLDFSEPSLKALHYGITLAAEVDAKLFLAHIVSSSPETVSSVQKPGPKQARARMIKLIPPEFQAELNYQAISRAGRVEDEILDIINNQDIDLLVMGTHGRQRAKRLFLGSIAEHMLRKVPVPILTVSHLDAEREMKSVVRIHLDRILYATDLGADSEAGLTVARQIAKRFGAEVIVMHVASQGLASGGDYITAEREFERMGLSLNSEIHDEQALVMEGVPHETIVNLADGGEFDLTILHVRRKGRVEGIVIGQTAERVIRTARMPVLSLPAEVLGEVTLGATETTAVTS